MGKLFSDLLTKHTLGNCNLETIKKGTFLVNEGEEINDLYFIVKGTTKVYKDYLNGKRILIGFFPAPTTMGDIEYMINQRTTCSVEAVTDISFFRFSFDELNDYYLHDFNFQNRLLKAITIKLLASNDKASINLMYPLETRLTSYLLSLYKLQSNSSFTLVNLQDLADHLGCSYRHLHRGFLALISKNIIKKSGRHVTIQDLDSLTTLAHGNIYEMENDYVLER
jgi:CRP-like cAMP-binding protein